MRRPRRSMDGNKAMFRKDRQINWVNASFLTISPLIALTLFPYHAYVVGVSWEVVALFVFYLVATGLSITGGYHRFFAHRAYQTNAAVKLFYLIFGAAACQNSALKWVQDHRYHHAYTDQEKDPYNIKLGFWYAHIGWVCQQEAEESSFDLVSDLNRDPMVRWQHRYYVTIAIVVGGVAPFLIGYLFGDALGAFLLAGITRMVIVHHSTFFINSLCHTIGKQPYTLQNSSRDSFVAALLTYGEGYHNFHHRFQSDYRNGVRWYQWDPTKWFIKALEMIGWAGQLRTVSDDRVFMAQAQVQKQRVQESLAGQSLEFRESMEQRLQAAYNALIAARDQWEKLKAEYRTVKASMDSTRREIAVRLRRETQIARDRFRDAHQAWFSLIEGCPQSPA